MLQVHMMPDYRADNPYQSLLEKSLQADNVDVSFSKGYRRILPILRSVRTQPNRVDVLHLHWIGPYLKGKSALVQWFYAVKLLVDLSIVKASGVRVVWTVHNLLSHDTPHARLEKWTRRQLTKVVDQLIVHNQSSKALVIELYQAPDSSISVIPIGHYRDIYASPIDAMTARQALGMPTTGNIYLWQGILRPYKGVESLLNIWSNHADLLSEHTLVIAGPAFDEAYREKIVNVAQNIKGVRMHLEFIEDERMHLFFSAATAVVLPFKQILTSSSLVLAMSYAKPVIAPRLGGVPETLDDADWLVYDTNESAGLLDALKKSLKTDLHTLGQIVEKVCDRMGWDRIAQKTCQLYKSVIES